MALHGRTRDALSHHLKSSKWIVLIDRRSIQMENPRHHGSTTGENLEQPVRVEPVVRARKLTAPPTRTAAKCIVCCGEAKDFKDAVARAGYAVRGGAVALDGQAGLHGDLMAQVFCCMAQIVRDPYTGGTRTWSHLRHTPRKTR